MRFGLLPDRLPEVPGVELAATYLPAGGGGEPGGDWYDVIGLADGSVGIAIGDVVGRGLPAESVVEKLRTGLREAALAGRSPSEVMRSVNALATDTRREMSTLVYVVLDPLTGRLCGSNAGHPPAMLRRAGGAVERWAAALAMPLGVTPEAGYGQSARTLGAGEALLLFTDGLIERRGLALEDALDRLAGLIPPAGGADDVRTAVLDGMLGEEDHDDDVAVLVVARPPAA